jgi:hypothetical protein
MNRRKPFAQDLALRPGDEPVDLLAYRIAQRLFWFRAAHDDEESLQSIYERVHRYLKEEAENEKKALGIRLEDLE